MSGERTRANWDNRTQTMSGGRMKALADEHLQSKTAMSFFCISGAQDDTGKFVFRSTTHTFITGAVAELQHESRKDERDGRVAQPAG